MNGHMECRCLAVFVFVCSHLLVDDEWWKLDVEPLAGLFRPDGQGIKTCTLAFKRILVLAWVLNENS